MCTTTKTEAGKSGGRLETIVSSDWIDPAEPPITTMSLGCNRWSLSVANRFCAAVPRVGDSYERGGCKESRMLEAGAILRMRTSGADSVRRDPLSMTERAAPVQFSNQV